MRYILYFQAQKMYFVPGENQMQYIFQNDIKFLVYEEVWQKHLEVWYSKVY